MINTDEYALSINLTIIQRIPFSFLLFRYLMLEMEQMTAFWSKNEHINIVGFWVKEYELLQNKYLYAWFWNLVAPQNCGTKWTWIQIPIKSIWWIWGKPQSFAKLIVAQRTKSKVFQFSIHRKRVKIPTNKVKINSAFSRFITFVLVKFIWLAYLYIFFWKMVLFQSQFGVKYSLNRLTRGENCTSSNAPI